MSCPIADKLQEEWNEESRKIAAAYGLTLTAVNAAIVNTAKEAEARTAYINHRRACKVCGGAK